MAFPTVNVTPGSGATINTLPAAGQNISANSLGVVIASDQATATNPLYIADAYTTPSAVTWTSATAVNTSNTVTTQGDDGVLISIVTGSGITGGVLTFEVYDGAAWIPVQAGKMNTYGGQTTFTLGASQTQGFQINIAGGQQFRTRLSTAITGTGNVVLTHIVSSAPMPDPVTVGLDPLQPLPAGTNALGSVTVTNTVAPTTLPLPTGAAAGLAQSSTTSGQTGILSQAAVLTSPPTYTTGNTNPLTLTTLGSVREDLATYNGAQLTGTVTAYGTAPTGNVFGVNASVTNTLVVGNLGTIASNTPVYSIAAGSTNKAAGVTIGTAVSQVDQNATAFAGSGSVIGTVVASAQGGGAVLSAEINVSALILGTATAVYLILQESTGGTNFSDIWVSDPFTATGIQRMPAIPVSGRRRWRAFSVGGTSTTVTVTVTSLELPAGYVVSRQMRDAYTATNPFALQYNSTALTASNFVLSALSTATTPFYIEGCKSLTAFMVLAGSPTVTTQPVVGLQLSQDGTNWYTVTGATMTAAGNGMYAIVGQNVGGAKFARLIVTTAAAYSAGSYTISNIGVNGVN